MSALATHGVFHPMSLHGNYIYIHVYITVGNDCFVILTGT